MSNLNKQNQLTDPQKIFFQAYSSLPICISWICPDLALDFIYIFKMLNQVLKQYLIEINIVINFWSYEQ